MVGGVRSDGGMNPAGECVAHVRAISSESLGLVEPDEEKFVVDNLIE